MLSHPYFPVVLCFSFMRTLGTGGKLGSLGALQGSLGDTGAWDLLSWWEARVSKVSSGEGGSGHGWEPRVSQVELLGDDWAWEPTQWKLLLCGKNISQLAFAPPSLSHCSHKIDLLQNAALSSSEQYHNITRTCHRMKKETR